MSRPARRRGFATAVALCMLAAVAGLAAGAFHAVVGSRRAATRALMQDQAAGAADAGLYWAIRRWRASRYDSLAVGTTDSVPLVGSGLPAGTRTGAYVTRLTQGIFSMTAVARVAGGTSVEAVQASQLLVELLGPTIPAAAALTARGTVLAGRDAAIVGGDSPPPGWGDCPPPDPAASPTVLTGSSGAARTEDGTPIPGAQVDTAAARLELYEQLGAVDTRALAARADVVLAPGAIVSPSPDTDGDCRAGDDAPPFGNWGEPMRTGRSRGCEGFFPVVHAAGDLTVTGGRGQGVLIVNGRLRIQGPLLFHGVVIARGPIDATGSDVRIYGTVLSEATAGVAWRAAGGLRRSMCAVARVAEAAARPYPLPRRAWVQLF